MADPISLTIITSVLSGAVGGGAGKFVEKAVDVGSKWLDNYMENHQPKARENAALNVGEFMKVLDEFASNLGASDGATRKLMDEALDKPDFSVLMKQAVLGAAVTDDPSKHDILARLVASRLTTTAESQYALAARLAVEAVPVLAPNQLKILAFFAICFNMRPPQRLAAGRPESFAEWLLPRLEPFRGLDVQAIDVDHLAATSCVQVSLLDRPGLMSVIQIPIGYWQDQFKLESSDVFCHLANLWNDHLFSIIPTSVGTLIGMQVSNSLLNRSTDFSRWGQGEFLA